jgi:glycosyltransferase involved in cell wall biosynthesis
MSSHIPTGRKLLVVSDTSMTRRDGEIQGFEPVVRELDSISNLFDQIIWLGYSQKESKTAMSIPLSANIKLVTMPSSGGTGILAKVQILMYYLIYFIYILRYLPGITHLHSRAPSHPALIAMWLSKKMNTIICWHKYAGSWNEPNPPKSYAFQRRYLASIHKNNVFGTINGKWPNQEKHLITFENPCLFEAELAKARTIAASKNFENKLTLLFVGNLSAFKGILQLVKALEMIDDTDRFEHLYIAGDGAMKNELIQLAQKSHKIKISVLGAVNRDELVKLYSNAHVNILPSESEGFPKVIAEGAAYGCIPLVTDVSSIGQYIHHEQNGFLLKNNVPETIAHNLNAIASHHQLKKISEHVVTMTSQFTYEYFNAKINSHFIQ